MEFLEAVKKRRSVRQFKPDIFPDDEVTKAFEAAILAPNSSNIQTWDFHWIKPTSDIKAKVIESCMGQAAARTASHLVVVVADPSLWKRAHGPLLNFIEGLKVPSMVTSYYKKLIPTLYHWGFLNCFAPFKWLLVNTIGLFRPMARGPYGLGGLQEVAIKSAALAAENFVLSIAASGGATCMMEGFDECRLRRILRLKYTARIVMVIGLGYEAERGVWGPRFRLPLNEVVHPWS